MSGRAGWTEAPLGYLVKLEGGSTPSKEDLSFWGGTIPWVSPKDMKRFVISDSEDHVTDEALVRTSLRLVAPPAVLTVVRGMILDHTVPIARLARPVTLNQDMKALRPSKRLDATFLAYALLARQSELLGLVEQAGHGTCCLRTDQLTKLRVSFPSLPLQRAIASFLDRKTAAVDALIGKKERLIELLQEKRQAVITQAVTKGLDPTSSSTAWRRARVKNVITFLTSGSRGWAEFYADDGPIFLRIGNLGRGTLELRMDDVQCVRPPVGAEGQRTRVQVGDVLFSITAFVGSIALVPQGLGEAYVSQHVALARPAKSRVVPKWLGYALLGQPAQEQLQAAMYGGTKVQLGLEDVKNIELALPPLDEQHRIAEYVEECLAELAKAANALHASVIRLREYRQALITAAVTGQVDVSLAEMEAA